MLPAQAAALGVAPTTHDQMETDDTKKRARDAATDVSDVDDRRSYIPPVGQPQPESQAPQPHEPTIPPPHTHPYPPSEGGVGSLSPDQAARLAVELASTPASCPSRNRSSTTSCRLDTSRASRSFRTCHLPRTPSTSFAPARPPSPRAAQPSSTTPPAPASLSLSRSRCSKITYRRHTSRACRSYRLCRLPLTPPTPATPARSPLPPYLTSRTAATRRPATLSRTLTRSLPRLLRRWRRWPSRGSPLTPPPSPP